jgi:hypothetical protein
MARRRVFRTRAKCPGLADFRPTPTANQLVGRTVTLAKSGSQVGIVLDGSEVGALDVQIASQVLVAVDRGQKFTVAIEKAFPSYNDSFKQDGAYVDLKIEYNLEKGQPPIDAPTSWRAVASSVECGTAKSFFTTVAGVTFEGRQGIVAQCKVGETLSLVRDPENAFDTGAIKILRSNGQQIGFVPAHVSRGGNSSSLAHEMDQGEKIHCQIGSLTGGMGKTLGVNIEITRLHSSEAIEPTPPPVVPGNNVGLIIFGVAVVLVVTVILFALR